MLSIALVNCQAFPLLNHKTDVFRMLNEEYIDHEGNGSDIWDSFDGGDIMDYPPDNQPIPNLIEWRLESSRNVILTTETPFEPICNPNSPIDHDPVIDHSEDEPIMIEDNLNRRPRVIKFILGQNFYDRGHFHDALKEFAIMNSFEL